MPLTLKRVLPGAPGPVEAFKNRGEDFVIADNIDGLVAKMNALTTEPLLTPSDIHQEIKARDQEITNPYSKDTQITAVRGARQYVGDRLVRVAAPHRMLDSKAGPLIAVRLNIISRKTLGGLETNLSGQVLGPDGTPIDGLFAAGEAAGFGGGGMHGYRSLEGTFLGGCLFSGRQVGKALST